MVQLAIMSQQTIYLQDALTAMKTLDKDGRAVPFSIKVRSLNRYSKTGGKLLFFEQAKLVMAEENPNANSINSLRTISSQTSTQRRNPNHFDNKTRNIKILPQNKIQKIHIRYIIQFNNKDVIY